MKHKWQVPDLTFPRMPIGTHGVPWDLWPLLHVGGASVNRRVGYRDLKRESNNAYRAERLPLINKFHEQITALLEGGGAVSTIETHLECLFRFVAWVDSRTDCTLSIAFVRDSFCAWTEHLLQRVRVKKDMAETSAYNEAVRVAKHVGLAIGITTAEPARALMKHTRLRRPARSRTVLGSQADIQDLKHAFEFGHALRCMCDALDKEAICGSLPIFIEVPNQKHLLLKGMLKNVTLDPRDIAKSSDRARAIRLRAPLADPGTVVDKRAELINARIEAELLIFVAQTGMNLAQAARLSKENYRWQSDGDELNAFRVYKGRRSGEAIFRCFKAYRKHMNRYFAWLDEMGLNSGDERYFPFIYHMGKAPPAHALPQFQSTKGIFYAAGIKFFGPRSLRKTRVNWLLRKSRDPDLTAEQVAHTKETLLTSYERPSYQVTAVEIVRFHLATDPSIAPPGPGVCAGQNRGPVRVADAPSEAPEPDCVSPDGCLFCEYHRDVMSADYCWKLASHRHIKVIEISLYKAPKKPPPHPGYAIVDRLDAKLHAISEGSEVRAIWVKNARDAVRSGMFHAEWDSHIQLMEALYD